MQGPRLRPSPTDLLLAGLAGLAALMGSFAVTGVSRAFVGSPVQVLIARVMPIEVIVFTIQTFGDLGQQINFLSALLSVVALVGAVALASILAARRLGRPLVAPLATGVGAWLFTAAVTGEPVLALGSGVPAALVVLAPRLGRLAAGVEGTVSSPRRQALATIGAAAGILGLGYASGTLLASDRSGRPSTEEPSSTPRPTPPPADGTPEPAPDDGVDTEEPTPGTPDVELDGPNVDARQIQAGLDGAAARSFDLAGVESLISERFYEVDINSIDPNVPREEWTLTVTGAVEESFEMDYEDVLALPAENRFVALRCVSDKLNGGKMDNALWTGFAVSHILERAKPSSDCGCVRLHAADKYFQVFPLSDFSESLLAYGMNGKPLPRGHGFPLRTLVPGHWGEINVKWLREIEFLNEDADGYWEQRGWQGTGDVVPIAKLEHERVRDGVRELGGRAYGGTRGVARVEVSTDGGETWTDAELSASLADVETPGAGSIDATDTLRQWYYEYEPPGERHTVVVRMVGEDGTVQPERKRDPYPKGASGWVSRTLNR